MNYISQYGSDISKQITNSIQYSCHMKLSQESVQPSLCSHAIMCIPFCAHSLLLSYWLSNIYPAVSTRAALFFLFFICILLKEPFMYMAMPLKLSRVC